MSSLSPILQQLINALQILPSVGAKTAQRMAFELLKEPMRAKALELAQQLVTTTQTITHCQQCRNYTDMPLCSICSDANRDNEKLCVVQSPIDLLAIENLHNFRGHYFVLMGYLSPIDGVGPLELGLDLLKKNIDKHHYTEIILATNATPEGQATAFYIHEMAKNTTTRISRIAFGVPMGGELEYLGEDTLIQALNDRKTL